MADAEAMDRADPLAFARARFNIPQNVIYLDGNSLGPLPAATPASLAQVVGQQWGVDLIRAWNKHDWMEWPTRIAGKLAPIVGAKPSELLIADSTSISLFKLLCAAVRARPKRAMILTSKDNFPTDLYVAQGLADMLGIALHTAESQDIARSIDEHTAIVTLTHVDYRSATMHDMRAINRAARGAGALTLWDLSHSAGAVELDLNAADADLAVGCGYKYLNGGPGAPAFLYVAERLQGELENPLRGWMGHAEPFAFVEDYRAISGIRRFQTGTPPILALAALDAGLDTFRGIAMSDVCAKSRSLAQLFIDEVEARTGTEVRLQSPRAANQRGSHVVFAHPESYAVMQALIERGVIGDFREPDLMRFGFAPLYNSHVEVVRAAEILAEIVAQREWDKPQYKARAPVT